MNKLSEQKIRKILEERILKYAIHDIEDNEKEILIILIHHAFPKLNTENLVSIGLSEINNRLHKPLDLEDIKQCIRNLVKDYINQVDEEDSERFQMGVLLGEVHIINGEFIDYSIGPIITEVFSEQR